MVNTCNAVLLAALGVLVASGACWAHPPDHQYRTSTWSTFPGYTGSLKASDISGYLTFRGDENTYDGAVTVIGGELSGLPSGSGAFAVYEGYDVDDKDTIGSPFYPRRCDNGVCKIYYDHDETKSSHVISQSPWENVKWTGPSWSASEKLKPLSWRMTLGRVAVLKDSDGKKAAIAQVIRKFTSLKYTYSSTLKPYDGEKVRGYVELHVPDKDKKMLYGLFISVNADGLSTAYESNGNFSETMSMLKFAMYKESCANLKAGGGTLILNKKDDKAGENPYGKANVAALNYFYDSSNQRTSGVAESAFELKGHGMTAKHVVGGSVVLSRNEKRVACGEIVRNYVPVASTGSSITRTMTASFALLLSLLVTLF